MREGEGGDRGMIEEVIEEVVEEVVEEGEGEGEGEAGWVGRGGVEGGLVGVIGEGEGGGASISFIIKEKGEGLGGFWGGGSSFLNSL